MPLPAGVEKVTVASGQPLVLPDGTWQQGRLTFTGPDLVTIGSQDVTLGGGVEVPLVDGVFSVALAATDATGMSPTGWTYKVTANLANAPDWTRYISLPKAVPSVALADVLVPDPVAGTYSTLVALGSANWPLPSDRGYLAYNFPPETANPTGVLLSSGSLALGRIFLRAPALVTNVHYFVITAGAGLTVGQCFAGLQDAAGNLIAASADQSTAMTTVGERVAPLVGGARMLAAGSYRPVLLHNGTTGATVARGTSAALGLANVGLTPANYMYGAYGSGLTAIPASIVPANITNVTNGTVWFALS